MNRFTVEETNGKFFSKAMQKEPLTDMEEV